MTSSLPGFAKGDVLVPTEAFSDGSRVYLIEKARPNWFQRANRMIAKILTARPRSYQYEHYKISSFRIPPYEHYKISSFRIPPYAILFLLPIVGWMIFYIEWSWDRSWAESRGLYKPNRWFRRWLLGDEDV